MRVAIQASDLDHERIDGTRVYLRELLKRFGPIAPETSFDVYHRGTFNPLLTPPTYENYRVVQIPFRWAWMQTRFALELFWKRPEKLFLPIQAAPVFLPRSIEVTATIHDLAFKRFPETFPKQDLWKLNFMLETAVKRAHKLIAVSESTKRDLLQFFPHLPESRITVIHHGFDSEFFGVRTSDEELEVKLRSYTVKAKNYLLYVGALQPRKNMIRLIQAFEILKRTVPEAKLVLAGEPAWLSRGILEAREDSLHRDDIVLTGRVSFEDLRMLYQGARVFAFPSLYEGFGLPILEAFASQVPVLTAENSSLMEVAGEGALFCQAEDTSDIAEKLERLWSDEALRLELIRKGNEQLKHFSWDKCAHETLEYIKS
ncbi:MAG: glycosyltransferase family 4 protein [Candidatus Moranbacteria bacterium]|nr:glycosyltransferase family 4 protein [Candidatus Moranbacteria bacterium]